MLAFLSFLPSFPNLSFLSSPPSLLSLPFLTLPFLSYLIQFLSILTFSATVPTDHTPYTSFYLIPPQQHQQQQGQWEPDRCMHQKQKKNKTKTKRFRIVMIMKRVSIRMHPMVFIIVHSGALGGQKAPEVVVNNYLTTAFFASEIM